MSYSLPARRGPRERLLPARQRGRAFRLIPYEIKSIEELNLPGVLADLRGSTGIRRGHRSHGIGQVDHARLDGRTS